MAGSTSRPRRRRSAERGLTRVLVEGGGQVAAAFLKAGLVDRLTCIQAALLLGADGRSAVGAAGASTGSISRPGSALVSAALGAAATRWKPGTRAA